MSQYRKYLVCVYFDLLVEGVCIPSDRVFLVSAESDQAACDAAMEAVRRLESTNQIKSCSSRWLNTVLSNPFYVLEAEGEATNANG